MIKGNYLFTSESVTEGHPDKLCDQISDAVLDEILRQDPRGRVACESYVTVGLVVIGGEITTGCYVDLNKLVRRIIKEVGYTDPAFGFYYDTCAVLNVIGTQSPDISQGVDKGGAGDQGLMLGYAVNETPQLMPLPIMLAHKLTRRLAEVRKKGILDYLGPDGKSQVTVEYIKGKPARVDAIVISSQHTKKILKKSNPNFITDKAIKEIIQTVVRPVIPAKFLDAKTRYFVNPTGKFLIGGPQSDTGMTGRKIIVDTYGGMCAHGGGAFSGKDPTKVDRSATYMARYVAKNIVSAGLADRCEVHFAYVIGVSQPVSVMIKTFGTNRVPEERIKRLVLEHFDLTPRGIIKELNLLRPIYRQTACYGHFGREEEGFTWERTDKAKILSLGSGLHSHT